MREIKNEAFLTVRKNQRKTQMGLGKGCTDGKNERLLSFQTIRIGILINQKAFNRNGTIYGKCKRFCYGNKKPEGGVMIEVLFCIRGIQPMPLWMNEKSRRATATRWRPFSFFMLQKATQNNAFLSKIRLISIQVMKQRRG